MYMYFIDASCRNKLIWRSVFVEWLVKISAKKLHLFCFREPLKSAVGAKLMVAFTFEDVLRPTVFEEADWWVREYNTNGSRSDFIQKALNYEIENGKMFCGRLQLR